MELNMEEIPNLGGETGILKYNPNSSTNDVNQIKYWEQSKIEKPKRKKVSFDDILTNMNLVVSQDGTLQYMKPLSQNNHDYQNQNQNQNQHQYAQPNFKQNNSEPIDPSVKHSHIYNKYFKDYRDMDYQPVGPRRPKSIQELKQMLRDDKIKEIQNKLRIAKIKSKQMFYTNNGGRVQPSINNFRSFNFN
jgi:hypothetical protein